MTDIFNLPNTDENFQIFYGSGDWQTWSKPRNAKFISMILISAGAGGGGGGAGSGVARTGSSGGGGGSITKGFFPAFLIPDVLYVNVGVGGSGGTSNTQGGAGSTTFVSITPNSTLANVILASNAAVAVGGNPVGTTSSSANPFVSTTSPFAYLGSFVSNGGGNSGVGGVNTGGAGGTIGPINVISPGAGGGGSSAANVNGAGGSFTAAGFFPGTTGGAAGGTNPGTNGFILEPASTSSNIIRNPLFNLGGAGGGANGAATGGDGAVSYTHLTLPTKRIV